MSVESESVFEPSDVMSSRFVDDPFAGPLNKAWQAVSQAIDQNANHISIARSVLEAIGMRAL